ncbi:probable histone chaperone ASF1A isoform X1 [Zingiber officinale]|uniref:probable histone chaperone ASF1A isoform X1 n=1 Tax=Zingiber officinale TaxID=94328 RepID=UPI001C4B040C|nr:probable histone chaperone ASF1A isoform X1 [Zingiber officinale]
MSAVNITNVTVLDNPTGFLSPFQFEISYECLVPLEDDLEWKLTYVGSAEDETYDQLLESVLVGPVNVGNYRFIFQADPPDPTKIREEDIIGVTVLLLTCSYVGQEFIRVGYYVNNDYDDDQLREEQPPRILLDRVQRNILADKPRVTKFPINFHPDPSENGGQQQQPTTTSPENQAVDDPRLWPTHDDLCDHDQGNQNPQFLLQQRLSQEQQQKSLVVLEDVEAAYGHGNRNRVPMGLRPAAAEIQRRTAATEMMRLR